MYKRVLHQFNMVLLQHCPTHAEQLKKKNQTHNANLDLRFHVAPSGATKHFFFPTFKVLLPKTSKQTLMC